MLDSKKSKGWGLLSKPKSPSLRSPSPTPELSSSSSGHSINSREVDTVMSSTTTDVGSSAVPSAGDSRRSGLPPSARLSCSTLQVPTRSNGRGKRNSGKNLDGIADDASSVTSSIWNEPWPEPPAPAIPDSLRPRSLSTGSSDTFGYPLYPTDPHAALSATAL
jgi:hypothetical protein